jgi:hypothetical protein
VEFNFVVKKLIGKNKLFVYPQIMDRNDKMGGRD